MAENKNNYHFDVIYNVKYGFNDRYGITFITPDQFNRVNKSLSSLRKSEAISGETYHILLNIFKLNMRKYYDIRYKISQESRYHAQKFIGKKNVRNFIFRRDGYKCLKCGNKNELSLDHIVPIYIGGENKLSNLQTLCKSCNSSKSTKVEDYREGANNG